VELRNRREELRAIRKFTQIIEAWWQDYFLDQAKCLARIQLAELLKGLFGCLFEPWKAVNEGK